MGRETYPQFMMKWAKKAFDMEDFCNGTLTGGFEPPRKMKSCVVTGANTVEVLYTLHETAGEGMSSVVMHTIDPHRVRSDEFVFTDDGEILCNGKPLFEEYESDDWLRNDVLKFKREYAGDLARFDASMYDADAEPVSKDPEPIGSIVDRVVANMAQKRDGYQAKGPEFRWPQELRNKLERDYDDCRFRLAKDDADILAAGRKLEIPLSHLSNYCRAKQAAVVIMEDGQGEYAGVISTDYSGLGAKIAKMDKGVDFSGEALAQLNKWREDTGVKGALTNEERDLRKERIDIYDELRQRKEALVKQDEDLATDGTVSDWKENRQTLASLEKTLEHHEEVFAREYPGEDLKRIGDSLEDDRHMKEFLAKYKDEDIFSVSNDNPNLE